MDLFGIPVWVVIVLVLLILVVYYYGYVKNPVYMFAKAGIETVPGTLPFIGNSIKMMTQGMVDYDINMYRKYKEKKFIGDAINGSQCLTIFDLDMMKNVMIKDSASFLNRFKFTVDDSSMNKMLTMLDDDHWKHVRSMCTSTFSSGKMRKMNVLIHDGSRNLVNSLGKCVEENKPSKVKDIFGAFALDVTASTIFGLQVNSLQNPEEPIVVHAKKLMQSFQGVSLSMILLLVSPRLFKYLTKLGLVSLFPSQTINYFETVIDRALQERRSEGDQGQTDFLQIMAKLYVDNDAIDSETNKIKWSSKGLLRDEILAQSFAFIFGGYENISNLMMYIAYCLALNPDVQDRLIKEIHDIIGNEEPDYDNVAKVEYLDMVINETQRLHTLAPRIDRICNETIEMNGVTIEKGWTIGVPIVGVHMDPDIWPEPEKFNPERVLPMNAYRKRILIGRMLYPLLDAIREKSQPKFSAENREGMHTCSYMPFGLGPRNCIAQRLALFEARIGIATIMQNFRFVPCKETPIPLVKNSFGQPKEPIILKLEKIVVGEE